jgi:hypothetical protein
MQPEPQQRSPAPQAAPLSLDRPPHTQRLLAGSQTSLAPQLRPQRPQFVESGVRQRPSQHSCPEMHACPSSPQTQAPSAQRSAVASQARSQAPQWRRSLLPSTQTMLPTAPQQVFVGSLQPVSAVQRARHWPLHGSQGASSGQTTSGAQALAERQVLPHCTGQGLGLLHAASNPAQAAASAKRASAGATPISPAYYMEAHPRPIVSVGLPRGKTTLCSGRSGMHQQSMRSGTGICAES